MSSKKRVLLLIFFSATLLPFIGYSQSNSIDVLQIDSNLKPQLFAPGIISTPFTEWSTSFSPDQQTVYTSRGALYWTIICSKFINGQWQKPQVVAFSGRWKDTDPFMAPNGKKMFFISNRPAENMAQDAPQKAFHIWYIDKNDADGWETPHQLDESINIDSVSNYAPSVSITNDLYFCSRNREGHSGMQSFVAKFNGFKYDKPEIISIKGVDEIQDPFIAPDGKYLLFVSNNDLFISYNEKNVWTAAEKLGFNINNGDGISSPYISANKKMLYYSTARVKGFYKRNFLNQKLDYDDLMKENNNIFNGSMNVLMIPVHFLNEKIQQRS